MSLDARVTLRKVAEKVGVSTSTVSRALRNSPQISDATKRRVRQAYLQLNGGVDLHLSLKPAAARTVAVLISRPLHSLTSDEFFSQVINGVVGYAERLEYNVLLTAVDARKQWRRPRILDEQGIDALIVGGVHVSNEYRKGLADLPIPTVFIGKHDVHPNHHAIIPDNVRGGLLAAEHLVAAGYRQFAFLGGDREALVFRDRLDGFIQGLANAGYQLRAGDICTANIDRIGGYEGAGYILDRVEGRLRHEPLGVFAATDWMAAGAVQALHERQIAIPEHVGIVGYTDLELAAHLSPPLTTIRIDAYALGYLALRLVEDLWNGYVTCPTQIWTQPQLIIRGTTSTSGVTERAIGE